MKYADFLAEVRKTGPYELTTGGKIRTTSSERWCPYLAVCIGGGVYFDKVNMTGAVWRAADNVRGHDLDIRHDLLKACGLAEDTRAQAV